MRFAIKVKTLKQNNNKKRKNEKESCKEIDDSRGHRRGQTSQKRGYAGEGGNGKGRAEGGCPRTFRGSCGRGAAARNEQKMTAASAK